MMLELWKIGTGSIQMSHLQSTNYMFFCSIEIMQMQWWKFLLRNFKLISGLKVNFKKSEVIGINVDSA